MAKWKPKKVKVCVTYMGPGKKTRKVCKSLTKGQLANMLWPAQMRITKVEVF